MRRIAIIAGRTIRTASSRMRSSRRRMAMLKPDTVMLACAFAWIVLFYVTIGRR